MQIIVSHWVDSRRLYFPRRFCPEVNFIERVVLTSALAPCRKYHARVFPLSCAAEVAHPLLLRSPSAAGSVSLQPLMRAAITNNCLSFTTAESERSGTCSGDKCDVCCLNAVLPNLNSQSLVVQWNYWQGYSAKLPVWSLKCLILKNMLF